MKDDKYAHYIYTGITAGCVIGVSIIIYFIFREFSVVQSMVAKIFSILSPILYGAVMAFLMSPVYNKLNEKMSVFFKKIFKKQKMAFTLSKTISTVVCVFLVILIVFSLIMMLIPQLIISVKEMAASMPKNLENLYAAIEKAAKDNPDLESFILDNYYAMIERFNSFIASSVLPNINKYIWNFSSGIISVVKIIFSFIIGIMVMIYLLNIKSSLAAQGKKMAYAFLSLNAANRLIGEVRYIKAVFSQFIVGKIIDSFIIGIINYIAMSIFKMPYALLISAIVGVTNVIPFFGPFIGAIPSAFIILLISPIQSLQFSVWILILQQIDGNIIGPKILGQTTGLSSFWILFSIILFGGLFGVLGMIIGVPTLAVVYRFLSGKTNEALIKKELPQDTMEYWNLEYINEKNKEFINSEK
jgi:hypothetical protein